MNQAERRGRMAITVEVNNGKKEVRAEGFKSLYEALGFVQVEMNPQVVANGVIQYFREQEAPSEARGNSNENKRKN